MVTKLLRAVIPLIIGMTTIFSTCKKRFGCADNVYSFQIGIKAFPDYDSIQVGDTLWLEVNSPVNFQDKLSGKLINYSGAKNLGTVISIAELIDVNNGKDATNNFHFHLIKGYPVNNPRLNIKEYLFKEENQSYLFKLGIVPQSNGVFKLFVGSASNVYRNKDKCTKASFGINFKNTNQHLYFNRIVLPDYELPSGGGIYFFKVL